MKALLITAVALLLAGASVQAAELGFRNKTSKALQLDCGKSSNKQFAYVCYDQDGNETYINEGAEWELIHFEKVCFQHDDGRIRACHELSKPGSTKKGYVCFDQEGKSFSFSPGNEWVRLAESDKACGELIHGNVIRYTDMPSLDIDL